ncbi:MAG TPA: sugar phosphate isomerase/epimerase family protein [Tepidisphaeraceae bacterium]|jgi:sugar phosphate isomerase/epimerase
MKLSLAGWSLNQLFLAKPEPKLKLLDFPAFTRDNFGIDAIELNSPFFESREPDYLNKLMAAAEKAGVKLLNIAVDEKGDLASDDDAERTAGVANYARWIPVAKEIGCSAIRANSGGKNISDRDRAIKQCIDSFRKLADEGEKHDVTILMENHWGLSSDADSIVRVMQGVEETHGEGSIGTLPDFGNWPDDADRYASLEKIMPWAEAVHAKVLDIDENLEHPKFDLAKCVAIAREGGYDWYLGIEYEGAGECVEGVKRAVKKLSGLI